MPYTLIALDIDGTIRSPEYPLSDRTLRTLDRVRDAGAVVTVATGRIFQSARRASAELDLRSPIASFQGAHIGDPFTGEVLWHRPLTEDMTLSALDALESSDHEVLSYVGDDIYATCMTPLAKAYGDRNGVNVYVVDDLRETAVRRPTRLVAFGEEDATRALELDLQATFGEGLYVTRSLPTFCEILHPESGKEKALEWLCARLGSRREEVVVFGNGYNDVPMIAWAGLGVAVRGGVPDALSASDRVARSIEEDGVALVLDQLLEAGLISAPNNR